MSIRSFIRNWLNAPDRQEREAKVAERIYQLRLDVSSAMHQAQINKSDIAFLEKRVLQLEQSMEISKHFTDSSLDRLSISIGKLSSRVEQLEANSVEASKSQVTSEISQ